jgi:lipoprotein-anchoring transpeptidase ErfK/SrfK
MRGNEMIYTMICSTGLDTNPDTSTPVGTFYIQKERGLSFYNASEKEGAKYWVSWKNHGEFLFHSVATDKLGNVIQSEAIKLGHKASHGCVRLAVPDAKWIYDNIRYNTKVVIS